MGGGASSKNNKRMSMRMVDFRQESASVGNLLAFGKVRKKQESIGLLFFFFFFFFFEYFF